MSPTSISVSPATEAATGPPPPLRSVARTSRTLQEPPHSIPRPRRPGNEEWGGSWSVRDVRATERSGGGAGCGLRGRGTEIDVETFEDSSSTPSASCRTVDRSRSGCVTGRRSTSRTTSRPWRAAAWTAASVCDDGCPLGTSSLTGTSPDETGGAMPSSGCTPPTTSPSSPGVSARRRAEAACVLGINQPPVTIEQVEVDVIDKAWEEGWVVPVMPSVKTGKKRRRRISSPAGLRHFQLTVPATTWMAFERADRIGGLLRYGIPEFKMEKRHLDRRIAQIKYEGTEFRTNSNVGDNVAVDDLKFATSTRSSWRAGLPRGETCRSRAVSSPACTRRWSTCRGGQSAHSGGRRGADHREGLQRGHHRWRRHPRHRLPRNAHRQGAKSIHQFEILPRPPEEQPTATPGRPTRCRTR